MWKRRQLKRNAKSALRRNYWRCVLAAVILASITGSFSGVIGGIILFFVNPWWALWFIIFTVILQEGKSAGLGTIGGMAETYWEKNKARSTEGKIEQLSKYLAIAFFVLAFILTINF